MRIGLTYDLGTTISRSASAEDAVAEFDTESTIDAISRRARSRSATTSTASVTCRQLAARLVAGERWDLVFNIAEGVARLRPRVAGAGAARGLRDPLYLLRSAGLRAHAAQGHGEARRARLRRADAGLCARDDAAPTPRPSTLPLPLFVKPVAEGTSKGVTARSLVTSRAALRRRLRGAARASIRQPVLVEEFLSGREFTVGILGTGADARAARDAGSRARDRRRCGGLFVPQQGAVARARRVQRCSTDGRAAPRGRGGRARDLASASAAATRAASTCGSTGRAARRSSR